MSTSSAKTALRADQVRTQGKVDSPALRPVLIRKGPKRVSAEADGVTSRWFDAAVGCWGKGIAYAAELGVVESFLSDMRAGKRGIALRHLLPMLGHVEAVLAFTAPLLESIGYVARPVTAPTFAQLAGAVLADLDDGSAVTRRLIENAASKRGWTAEQVALALHGEDK